MAAIFTTNRAIKASSGYYAISTPAGPNHLLNASGGWTHPSAVVGVSSDTQILYNAGGVMTGTSTFVWDYLNDRIVITGSGIQHIGGAGVELDSAGPVSIGDVGGAGNNTQLVIDDTVPNVTLNADMWWSSDTVGPVVRDSGGNKWRIGVSLLGVLTTTAI